MPDLDKISTSYAEHQNLTERMSLRRCTRLTNATIENHAHLVTIHYMQYSFCRKHYLDRTPAKAAGITDRQ